MALIPLCLIISLTILLHYVAAQRTNGSISVGASLTATPDAKPWLSSSGEFALGFQNVQGTDRFLLSIWYDKIPEKTIVWFPEGGLTVATGSKVDLVDRRGLVLSDPQGKEVWSSGSSSDHAYGYMNDTGNFVIVGSNSSNIWESFKYPSDTILPTQVMPIGGVVKSKMGKTNFTGGKYQLHMLEDGNLVLKPQDMFTGSIDNSYYDSGTSDDANPMNSGSQLVFDATGYLYILTRNETRVDLTGRDSLPSGDYYHRATLDSDGVFTQCFYPKNSTEATSWEITWFVPEDIRRSTDSKACQLNGVCILDNIRPKCECPQGFSLVDPNTPNGDCKPNFTPSCDDGESNHGGDVDGKCWNKQLPLKNGFKDPSYNVKALVKFSKIDGPSGTGGNKTGTGGNKTGAGEGKSGTGEDKSGRNLIFVGSVLLGMSVLGIVVLIGVIYVFFFQIHQKKAINSYRCSTTVETNLPRFTYEELVKATDWFKDEMGKGAFGIVYKGVIGTKIVAVKKLETVFKDGQKEFQTEVNTIARTHHKNLVQLLGYCDDGEQRLLIYEYMTNGTLAVFLFGDMRPSWKQRSYIAVGVAKGLTYLHEDCSNQTIHCDIKPQNILLDDYYNAKITDFGLAKLLMINQSQTHTGIRGTKGYVAPE
ncbi:putative protein kinase RLK-Pelle-SD-2b family [Helianthus annuus]|nr:putative protein kinase RLK-Pelle-SD-2b family [Helianthus annuus]